MAPGAGNLIPGNRPAAGLTVGGGTARGLADFAATRGAPREALLAAAGIVPAAIADQDARLPVTDYRRLMRAAKAMTGDPALALHYAEAVDLSQISVVGLLGHASADMLEAFAQLNRYGRLAVEVETPDGGDRFRHVWRGGRQWLVDMRCDANGFHELTETTFARMVCGTRAFGRTPFVEAVHVTHPDPGYRAEYERVLGAPVRFEADWNAMLIDAAWHANPIQLQPRYALDVLSRHADGLVQRLGAGRSARAQVEGLLQGALAGGQGNVAFVAAQLGISRQTLFRRLKAEGTSFAAVLDDLRRRLALERLCEAGQPVGETAYSLGFSDPAAFSRAFKRWTGQSPRAARGGRAPS